MDDALRKRELVEGLRFGRDLAKGMRNALRQIVARLFYVRRSRGDSIALDARLDLTGRLWRRPRHSIQLGEKAEIESRCVLNAFNGAILIGPGSSVGIGSIIIGPVEIGRDSAIAQNCFVSGANHVYADPTRSWQAQGMAVKPVIIGDGVWIGANCVILPGVEIGSHSVVGAGSVVTRSIPPFSVAVGNPANVKKAYDHGSGQWRRAASD